MLSAPVFSVMTVSRGSSAVERRSHTPEVAGSIPAPASSIRRFFGGVAQLGERLLCKQDVAGSIPVTSTSLVCSRHVVAQSTPPFGGAGQQSGRQLGRPIRAVHALTDPRHPRGDMHKRGSFPGCSAAVARLLWEQDVESSIPSTPTILLFAPVAQGIEQPPPKRQAARSSRAGRAIVGPPGGIGRRIRFKP